MFQETASREAGAGWIYFFQCLFQMVVVEKKAAVKKGASVQGELPMCPRLGERRGEMSRWCAEVAEAFGEVLSASTVISLEPR